MRRITNQQLMNGKRRKKKQKRDRHKRDMDPVILKKSLNIKQKMLMFGLGGYRHNHPPSISLGNLVTSPRDENCPRQSYFKYRYLLHVQTYVGRKAHPFEPIEGANKLCMFGVC
jgi:hypothetical protein